MRLEPRTSRPVLLVLLLPGAGAARCGRLLCPSCHAVGASPFQVFGLMIKGALGSQFACLETLTRATPLIFTGLAVAVAFRAKLWNIGAEAQLYIGAVMTVVLAPACCPCHGRS